MAWSFSVAGVSGGWTAWGSDTDYELRANALAALEADGLTVSRFVLEVGDDASARVLHNSFPYRATVTVDAPMLTNSSQAADVVLDAFRLASGANEPTISDAAHPQPRPPSYLRSIGGVVKEVADEATWPLMLVAIALVAVAVVMVEK